MEDRIKNKFFSLVSRLSPENLHMDGEASKSQVIKRLREIKREWRALEKELGRKVYEDEIWSMM